MGLELNQGLQARLRQLFGTRGGPQLTGADFLQTVAVIASAEGPFRNPAYELGEGIKRGFVAQASGGPVALEFSTIAAQVFNTTTLCHIREVGITLAGVQTDVRIGRVASPIAAGLATATGHYVDLRLPFVDIATAGGFDIQGGTHAAAATFIGFRQFSPAVLTTTVIPVDYILVGTTPGAGGAPTANYLAIQAVTSNTQIRAWVAGELYDFGPGAR